ncbi:hypothetical protein [Streptomyces sp. NPDC001205]
MRVAMLPLFLGPVLLGLAAAWMVGYVIWILVGEYVQRARRAARRGRRDRSSGHHQSERLCEGRAP